MREPTASEWLAALPGPAAYVKEAIVACNEAWPTVDCPFAELAPCGADRLESGAEGTHHCAASGRTWRWHFSALGEGYLVQLEDVTEVEATAVSERRLADALAGTDDGTFDWDLGSGRVTGSDRLYGMLGYGPDDLQTGSDWERIIHPDDRDRTLHALTAHLRGETSIYNTVVRLRHADGTYRFIDERGRVVERAADGRAARLAGSHRDITDYKLLEQRLLANDRMASLGRLAAGLAHEVNNPLGYVIGNLDLLSRDLPHLPPSSRARGEAAVEMAKEGALRVRDIIRDLQALSRAQRSRERKLLDPTEVLRPALRMLEGQVADRAQVEVELESVPLVHASPAQLAQVVLNVLTYVRSFVVPGDPDRQTVDVRASTCPDGGACLIVSHEGLEDLVVQDAHDLGEQDIALGVARSIVDELGGEVVVEVGARRVRLEVRLRAAEVEAR